MSKLIGSSDHDSNPSEWGVLLKLNLLPPSRSCEAEVGPSFQLFLVDLLSTVHLIE